MAGAVATEVRICPYTTPDRVVPSGYPQDNCSLVAVPLIDQALGQPNVEIARTHSSTPNSQLGSAMP